MNENHRNIGVRKRVRSLTGQFYFLEENKLARCTYAERRNPGRILSRMHDRLLASLIDYAADCSRLQQTERCRESDWTLFLGRNILGTDVSTEWRFTVPTYCDCTFTGPGPLLFEN